MSGHRIQNKVQGAVSSLPEVPTKMIPERRSGSISFLLTHECIQGAQNLLILHLPLKSIPWSLPQGIEKATAFLQGLRLVRQHTKHLLM